jgi:hypothetical protein
VSIHMGSWRADRHSSGHDDTGQRCSYQPA